jgi:hypothetical protein
VRTRLAPLALVPLLVLTGCSSGGDARRTALGSTPSPTTASTSTASPGSSPAVTWAPAPAAVPATRGAGATGQAVAPASTGAPAVPKAAAPGTYLLDTSGTITYGTPGTPRDAAGTQTLTVAAPKGTAQHSALHGDQGDTEHDLLFRDTGTYMASLKLTSPAFTKEFRPTPAVLLVGDPARPGTSWSWSMTSTDGTTTAHADHKVARSETVTVGGTRVSCAVLVTHLVLSGDVSYTADITPWWSPAHRLPVKDHTVGKGTVGAFPFQTDISTLMRSVTPS